MVSVVCIWIVGYVCLGNQTLDDRDHDRKGMTSYMAKKYGGPKKKRKYTKHKRYFKVEQPDRFSGE